MHYIISFRAGGNIYWFHRFRAGGNGPAAPVLAGPVFLNVKNRSPFLQKAEVHFYKKQVVKKSASVICWTC